jgi:hypothetical protein
MTDYTSENIFLGCDQGGESPVADVFEVFPGLGTCRVVRPLSELAEMESEIEQACERIKHDIG